MSGKTVVANVREWLATQGFPLEMKVAAELRKARFQVWQGVKYGDSEPKKTREIDVVAEASYFPEDSPFRLRVVLVIECKRATSKPWVLLSTADAGKAPLTRFTTVANQAGRNLISNLDEVGDLSPGGLFKRFRAHGVWHHLGLSRARREGRSVLRMPRGH